MADIRLGDMISVPGRVGFVRHSGIFAGFSGGTAWVIHNSKQQRQVVLEPWAVFTEGRPVRIERRAASGMGGPVVDAARRWLGTEYELTTFNCEHFVTAVHDGCAKSPQLAGWTTVSLLGLAYWAFSGSGSSYDPFVDRYRDRAGRFTRG